MLVMRRTDSSHFLTLADWLQTASTRFSDDHAVRLLERSFNDLKRQSDAAHQDLLLCLQVLDELQVDAETLAGAAAYHSSLLSRKPDQLLRELPPSITSLVVDLGEIDRLESAFDPRSRQTSAEGLRRLLLALVGDVRVVLIVLAHRLVRLRAMADADDETRSAYATLVKSIHAPLANRLGVWQIKWELEDLVFRYLEPETYRRIAKLLAERRADRERYIADLVTNVEELLQQVDISCEVKGRPKHIFSIWKKMQKKSLAFEQVFDVRAIRILVEDVAQCYATLGLIHSHWQPVPGEFDDYIANPKPNLYQSLHTAVFGPQGKAVEVQIRTREMHDHAELGVAAHWRYKEGGQHDAGYQRKLNWMRQLLESDDGNAQLLDDFGQDEDESRVYVLTPRGDVIDLRVGSTVLDFAYHIHTNVGHRCRGAKVNGRIVPLTYCLNNGEQIQILTGKESDPSRDWMVPSLGYLASPRARNKVRQWFRAIDHDRNVADGKDLLDRELKRLAVKSRALQSIAERLNLKSVDALYVALAIGEVTPAQVANQLEQQQPALEDEGDEAPLPLKPSRTARGGGDDIIIEGVGNLMTTIAKCCNPVPGESITGYITRTRGVSIHREDCRSVDRLVRQDPDRLIEVAWGSSTEGQYQAEVLVIAFDRKGLIRDVGQTVSNCRNNLLAINTQTHATSGQAEMRLSVEVGDFEQLGHLLRQLQAVPNVLEVRRIG